VALDVDVMTRDDRHRFTLEWQWQDALAPRAANARRGDASGHDRRRR
jgi:hypothetical protein